MRLVLSVAAVLIAGLLFWSLRAGHRDGRFPDFQAYHSTEAPLRPTSVDPREPAEDSRTVPEQVSAAGQTVTSSSQDRPEDRSEKSQDLEAAISACASAYKELDWRVMASCRDQVMARLQSLDSTGQYSWCAALSYSLLEQLVRVVATRPMPDAQMYAPLNYMNQYPPGFLQYMLEAAAGDHGRERMLLSLPCFVACADCPDIAYQPAREVLKLMLDRRAMFDAVLQLSLAPRLMGEWELLQVVQSSDTGIADLRGPAIRALAKQGSLIAADAILNAMSSSNVEDVTVGVSGLQALARSHPELITSETEQEFITAIDSVYGVLDQSQRISVILALLPLSSAPGHLRLIATAEQDDRVVKFLYEAAASLEDGIPPSQLHQQLINDLNSR